MIFLDIQIASESTLLPSEEQLRRWVDSALPATDKDTEIVIRIIDEQESADLNQRYRHKTGPTNILSFPSDLPEEVDFNLLGDLLVCAPVVEQEAKAQQKRLFDHWAHIIIHGVLHLIGHDHIQDHEAEIMENLEIDILKKLNIANPYIEAFKP